VPVDNTEEAVRAQVEDRESDIVCQGDFVASGKRKKVALHLLRDLYIFHGILNG
jgi:hypothetical protein